MYSLLKAGWSAFSFVLADYSLQQLIWTSDRGHNSIRCTKIQDFHATLDYYFIHTYADIGVDQSFADWVENVFD